MPGAAAASNSRARRRSAETVSGRLRIERRSLAGRFAFATSDLPISVCSKARAAPPRAAVLAVAFFRLVAVAFWGAAETSAAARRRRSSSGVIPKSENTLLLLVALEPESSR